MERIETNKLTNFQSLRESVGKFLLGKKTVLIPEMNRLGSHLFAAAFRGFGIDAKVLETYKGLDLGKEYTSGKECYPCQVTMGDILHFLKTEKETLGEAFNPEDYVYFLPESDGPCRYGMYNKYQRIVLDSFPEMERLKIYSLTTTDGYATGGMLAEDQVLNFRKAGYYSFVVADILDRLLWRIRPYEREAGMADEFIEKSMHVMADAFETYGAKKAFSKILDKLEDLIEEGKAIIDPNMPRKPLIGIVGEIFLRMHVHSNQDLIRVLERHGAEVVNASFSEWINFVSYEGLRNAKKGFRLNLKGLRLAHAKAHLKEIFSFGADLYYQERRLKQAYKRIKPIIDLAEDHKISHLENILKRSDLFSFDMDTEACLSIAGILQYAREGYNGVVNVYPFTCMPSITTSAIVKPIMGELRVPYMDTLYDGSYQPGNEAAIRTFMYQAFQHLQMHGRKGT